MPTTQESRGDRSPACPGEWSVRGLGVGGGGEKGGQPREEGESWRGLPVWERNKDRRREVPLEDIR